MPWSVLTGRVVAPGEPAWTQEDSDLAVALTEMDAERCDGCGQPRHESMATDGEFAYGAEPVRCHACATRDRAARKRSDESGWDDAGIRWVTVKEADGG